MGSILLVEDNPDDVTLTLRALRKAHIRNEMVVVGDGREALDYLWAEGRFAGQELSELPAVVLLDLILPTMDGLECLSRIRSDARTRLLPVVLLTSSKEESDRAAGYDRGANGYVRKPVDFADFAAAVATLGAYWLLVNEPPPSP